MSTLNDICRVDTNAVWLNGELQWWIQEFPNGGGTTNYEHIMSHNCALFHNLK